MAKTFVFVNQKGGVGKTTSAINIGAYIAITGKRVLLVDFDSQGNMSSGVGVSKDKPTIYELLSGESQPEETVKHTMIKNLDAISASIDLSGAAITGQKCPFRQHSGKSFTKTISEQKCTSMFSIVLSGFSGSGRLIMKSTEARSSSSVIIRTTSLKGSGTCSAGISL